MYGGRVGPIHGYGGTHQRPSIHDMPEISSFRGVVEYMFLDVFASHPWSRFYASRATLDFITENSANVRFQFDWLIHPVVHFWLFKCYELSDRVIKVRSDFVGNRGRNSEIISVGA